MALIKVFPPSENEPAMAALTEKEAEVKVAAATKRGGRIKNAAKSKKGERKKEYSAKMDTASNGMT